VNATKVVWRNSLVFWRAWRSSMFLSVLTPVMFLSAMGLGLGSLVDPGAGAFGGAGYLAFFSTGMLAANAMQSGTFAATYPVMSKITWQKNYEAMLATPLVVRDVFFGELSWIAITLAQQTIPFFLVMALLGVFDSPLALVSIPIAILVGLGFGAVTIALTATLKTDEAYTWLFRFVVTPLFLLSGTFFPVDGLPSWGAEVARLTPLYHGIELVRQFTVAEVAFSSAILHLLYLIGFLALGVTLGIRNLTHRLVA
jgi:lipooligosaccharide transport system permease protein